MKPAAALLFSFLLGLYLVSSAGHTSSNDEEEMYYMTQGLVERHSLALPDDAAIALWTGTGPRERAADGHFYSYHQPLTSILAIPLYIAGKAVAAHFDPRYRGLVTRGAVTALSALSTAAMAVVVELLALELGASAGSSLVIALIFGVATMAWAYARNFWSDPVATLFLGCAVLFALRAVRRGQSAYWLGCSVALLLGIATRWATVASLPAFAIYLLAAGGRPRRRLDTDRRLTLLAWAAPFSLVVIVAAVVVAMDPARSAALSRALIVLPQHAAGALSGLPYQGLTGVYGLLVSPGKSVFLYSPPLLLSALFMLPFVRRWPHESLFFGALVVSHVVLAGLLPFGVWAGDAAWGPRYLLPVLPYLLLPLILALPPRRPVALAVVTGLGVLVQLFPIGANFDTYILLSNGPRSLTRWFRPEASPLIAAPRQALERFGLYAQLFQPDGYSLAAGFYQPESNGDLPRWTTDNADIVFRLAQSGPIDIRLELIQPDHGHARPLPALVAELDGRAISYDTLEHPKSDLYLVQIALPRVAGVGVSFHLLPETFQPAAEDGGDHARQLGVELQTIDARSDRSAGVRPRRAGRQG